MSSIPWNSLLAALLLVHTAFVFLAHSDEVATASADSRSSRDPIPWSEIAAKAGPDYQGDGLAILAGTNRARLRCVFQKLAGEVTSDGLWLSSTAEQSKGKPFRVIATTVGRGAPEGGTSLSRAGMVSIHGQTARFTRPGLIEEYSVSMDGVRQDFVVGEKPTGEGELRVELNVTGAKVEPGTYGAQLVLEKSGRKIAYSRLRVSDATGRELPARLQVQNNSAIHTPHSAFDLAVLVDDTSAVYPIRIDPTFSDANWIRMGGLPGTDGTIWAAEIDASDNLYIGGEFTIAGEVFATNVAKWVGTNWAALGSGVGGGDQLNPLGVFALAVSGSDLYVGGSFATAGGTPANRIAKWNGTNWSALGSGLNNTVTALAVSGDNVYAGGNFSTAGGTPANAVAKWNGTGWSALGSGMNGYLSALAVSGNDLYAGGQFTRAGDVAANSIARWNGSSWLPLGLGVNQNRLVLALAVSGSDLYVGGSFETAGGLPATNIARWNGASWSAVGSGLLGSGINSVVYSLGVSGNNLYAGGFFTNAGGTAVRNIAKWNGSSWSSLGSGMNGGVFALAADRGGNVYAAGNFTTAGGNAANRVAGWNGSAWFVPAANVGVDKPFVFAVALSGNDLYVGGAFTKAGGLTVNGIAKWNGSRWSALGSGVGGDNPFVNAIAVSGSEVYVGGTFTFAGGNPANHIAKWNGSTWSPLESGVSGSVSTLTVSGSDLYVGGSFATAGGNVANNVAKWSDGSWSPLGSGVNRDVDAIAVLGGDVYVGGWFTMAGDTPANYVAKWDGSFWQPLGGGMNNWVFALAVSGNDLYAGGWFTMADGNPANYIAKWNGSSWSALGSGLRGGDPFSNPGRVVTLAISGGDLYAGGIFDTAGGSPANNIAKWDGTNWSALGSGLNGFVVALAASDIQLYVGGDFTTAGGKVGPYLVRAYIDLPHLSIVRSGGNVTLSWPASFGRFAVQQNADAANANAWTDANYPLTTNGPNKSATVPMTPANQFFRLIER